MKDKDTRILLNINDRVVARDIQGLLGEAGIYTMLVSDNPAASALRAYMGVSPSENIDIVVHINNYQKAVDYLGGSPCNEFLHM